MKQLTHPAPSRNWFQTHHGLWASRPWSLEKVAEVLSASGWFQKGRHDFADLAATKAANCESPT